MRETEGELVKSFNEKDEELLEDEKKSARNKFLIISILSILIALIIVVVILIFTVFKKDDDSKEEDEEKEDDNDLTELDTIPSEELNKARKSFQQFNYIDSLDQSKVLPYNLFIPEKYNASQNKKYPLMVFIGDSSTIGHETTYPLNQTVGGPIWATDTVQKKHECFVLVPEYNTILIDDNNGFSKNEYINVTVRLILEIQNKYKIDSNKIYGTGQSMGAMTTLYYLANYPDLYTAGLIVDGQWILDELLGLINSTFIYFAAGGDKKAFDGQTEIRQYLEANNISYGYLKDVNAKENVEILNNDAQKMLDLKYQYNFITYLKGSVLPNKDANEHLSSFKYGYRIETVRDWIFEQNKVKCEEGLYYSEDGKCSITNFCASSKEDHSCSECIYGYYLSNDKLACTTEKNCKEGNKETGLCDFCPKDFYLDMEDRKCKSNLEEFKFCTIVDKGACTACEMFYYVSKDNKCSISANCSIVNEDLSCSKCIDGYYLGLDNKCTDVEKCIYSSNNICTECEDGYYYDCFDKLCKEAIDNFENCKINAYFEQTQCFVCKDNFCLNQRDYLCYDNTEYGPYYKCQKSNNMGDFCQICIDGYFIGNIDLNCTKIEGCLKSLDENTCLICDDYYCIDSMGNCTDNSYVISEDKKFYFRCKMLNEEGTECALCDYDFNTTDEGICYDDYDCEKDENGECVRCQDENPRGYPSFCLNKEFGCIDSFLDNCIRCDNIFDMDVCTECEEGYEIDEYGDCVEIE